MPGLMGGVQASGLPSRNLRLAPRARQGKYNFKKGSAGGAPALRARESVWLDSIFPLLTILAEKSSAERC